MKVEAVGDAISGDMLHQRLFHVRVVVPVVQRGAAGEEVDVAVAFAIEHFRAAGAGENGVHATAVGARFALAAGKDGRVLCHILRHRNSFLF